MPTLKDFNARNRRESLSLFEDESRSHCTVEEAQAYQQTLARARRRRALMVVIPLLAALVGVGIYLHLRAKAAAREQARHEEEEKQQMASPRNAARGWRAPGWSSASRDPRRMPCRHRSPMWCSRPSGRSPARCAWSGSLAA